MNKKIIFACLFLSLFIVSCKSVNAGKDYVSVEVEGKMQLDMQPYQGTGSYCTQYIEVAGVMPDSIKGKIGRIILMKGFSADVKKWLPDDVFWNNYDIGHVLNGHGLLKINNDTAAKYYFEIEQFKKEP